MDESDYSKHTVAFGAKGVWIGSAYLIATSREDLFGRGGDDPAKCFFAGAGGAIADRQGAVLEEEFTGGEWIKGHTDCP